MNGRTQSRALILMSEAYLPLPFQFIFLRSEPQLKAPMAGAICERSRGWCSGSLLVMPLSSGRFPEPDPPHPGTQGRGGVKTWRAFAWSLWACNHLLPAYAQLATFDPTKFELKRGWWLRSSSLLWRSGGGVGGGEEEQRFTDSRWGETWWWHGNESHFREHVFYFADVFPPKKWHIVLNMHADVSGRPHVVCPRLFSAKEHEDFISWSLAVLNWDKYSNSY